MPALVSYDDDGPAGDPPTQISYPVAEPTPLMVDPRPGGDPNAGDVVVTLRFWRPQRARIASDPAPQAGESSEWTDIGGLGYVAGMGAGECPAQFFTEDDPNLRSDLPLPLGAASVYTDARSDHPANPNETLAFTFHVTDCMESQGVGSTFDEAGEERVLLLTAAGGGRAHQTMTLKRSS